MLTRRVGKDQKLRLGLIIAAVVAVLVVSASVAFAQRTSTGTRFQPGAPEPGTSIPTIDVKFGQRPYADNTFYVIAMKRGWFKDVGINIVPPPYGIKDSDNALALMLKGQVDVQAMFGPTIIPTMKASNASIKMIALTDLFGGWAILANPDLHLKTVQQYMAQGLSFKKAMNKALTPLAGQTLVVAPLIDARPFVRIAFDIAGVPQPKLQVLDDSKSLVLAKAKRIKFGTPTGAPITLSFEQMGWAPLVTPFDILENMPGSPTAPWEALVATVGTAANESYIAKNPNTILRIVSVIWRTIDAIQKDPKTNLTIQAPYLNSVAGTSLDWKAIQQIFRHLDPLSNFQYQSKYCLDTKGTLYYKTAYASILRDYAKQKLIPAGKFAPDDLIWACQIFNVAVSYKHKTDTLLSSVGKKTLSPQKKELVAKAKRYYAWFDFLDAYRFAKAATA
jgi:hypothetical protein